MSIVQPVGGGNRTNQPPVERQKSPAQRAAGITVPYFVIGCLWILFSDKALAWLLSSFSEVALFSIIKGFFFVVVTALLLFFLFRKALEREREATDRLDRSFEQLKEQYSLLELNQQKLQESEERFRLVFQEAPEAFAVIDMETDRFIECNQAALDISAVANREQLFRLSPTDLMPETQPDGTLSSEEYAELKSSIADKSTRQVHDFFIRKTHGEVFLARVRAVRLNMNGRDALFIVLRDITESRRSQEALRRSEEQLRVTLNSIGDGVIATDRDGRVTMINGIAGQYCGLARAEAVGRPIGEVMKLKTGDGQHSAENPVNIVLRTGRPQKRTRQLTLLAEEGAEYSVSCSASPIVGTGDAMLGAVLVFRDTTEQRKREAEILYLSYHDQLTGLYNRTFFEEELKRLDTERQLPLSIIMGDANNLKMINDVFGHREGDQLLKLLSKILKDTCRTEDIISRWGGDEFTVLLPRTDGTEAARICERISRKCHEYATSDENRLNPSISLGFCTKTGMAMDTEHVVKAAEDMMYQNKLRESKDAHSYLMTDMRKRIVQGRFETEGHADRLIELCVRVGREMGLQENELNDMRVLALLHDIGKVAIDRQILSKPDKLSEDEWEEVKRHSAIGYRIARIAPELVTVADYILGHHERWDGLGYPQGLKGEQIPLVSRIFSVAEAFDVMTHSRSYERTLTQEEALHEIFDNAGKQFDPEVVNVFAGALSTMQEVIPLAEHTEEEMLA